jgi:hypothetical protein
MIRRTFEEVCFMTDRTSRRWLAPPGALLSLIAC